MTEKKKMVNGKVRNVHTGKKGGKYYMSKGKKVYFGALKRQRSSGSSNRSDKKRPRNLCTAILGRTMQALPIQSLGQGFTLGYTQAITGPRAINGTSCDQIPEEYRADCKRDYCIRDPLSEWCLKRKIDYRGVDGRQVPERGPFWQSQCDIVEPNLASNLQTLARKKIFKRQYTAASNILYNDNPVFYKMFGSLAPAQQREILLRMGVPTMADLQDPPPPGPPNPISRFGKKKAKRNTKKKTKQTRK
jgi:hypothetical protein